METITDVITYCPKCGYLHLDEGEWYNKPHKTHLCLECGHLWRVLYVDGPTRGIMDPDLGR